MFSIIHAEKQRAEGFGGVVVLCVAADDHFLALLDFYLEPVTPAVAGFVGAFEPFGDHSFETHLFCGGEKLCGGGVETLAFADRACVWEDFDQELSALL